MTIVTSSLGFLIITSLGFISSSPRLSNLTSANNSEMRCGWLSNPTPANASLYDSDGEWIIGVQGGYQIEGGWQFPNFKPGQWIITNTGSYGYGCACLQVRVNSKTKRVLEVESAQAKPLSACREDRALKQWGKFFK